jgi:hypothetical protein
MAALTIQPGPDAARAFRLGVIAGAIIGLVALGGLYWTGTIAPVVAGYALVVLFPVYLVFVAVVLSRWLGYDKDATSLRPVYRPKNSE